MRAISIILFAITLIGCSHSPFLSGIYADVRAPLMVSSETTSPAKQGSATFERYLGGLIHLGDGSIEKAMQAGEIRKIHHIDYQTTGSFFHQVVTITVYGN